MNHLSPEFSGFLAAPPAQPPPTASLDRRLARLPSCALIDHIVGCCLGWYVPLGFDLAVLYGLRITDIPQRWPGCRGRCAVLQIQAEQLTRSGQ